MITRRTYLDTLNAGRQRRSGNSIEEINRTLDDLADRLESALKTRETTKRGPQAHAPYSPEMHDDRAAAGRRKESSRRAELERNTRDTADRRREGGTFPTTDLPTGSSAARDETQATADSGIREELGNLRQELERLLATQQQAPVNAELNTEFDRLSDAIALLAERSDDRSAKMLRLELEQMKAALAKLAREDTVRSLGQRWDSFETRLSSDLQSRPDPAAERLAALLDEIGGAVGNLPDSLAIRSLDERMQQLTKSLDQLADQRNPNQPDLYELIEERLDEISRAVSASTLLAQSPGFDPSLLERIEARISSLGKQIDELVQDQDQGGDIILDRLTTLSDQVDAIARRADIPEQLIRQLAAHLAKVSDRIEAAPDHREADRLLGALEDRFGELSDLIQRQQEDTFQQGQAGFQHLERRLQAIAERIEQFGGDRSGPDLRALEERLDDIADRLQGSPAPASGVEPETVRELANQIATLSDLVARTGNIPASPDVAPRLESLEQTLKDHRAEVTEAVRQAAMQATRRVAATRGGTMDQQLKLELKTLEALTRQSDERNARTFEAIHDTLLKIVSRFGDMQVGPGTGNETAQDWLAIDPAPSIDPADGFHEAEPGTTAEDGAGRTPSKAAAAEPASRDKQGAAPGAPEGQRRLALGGLSRAFSGRRNRNVAAERHEDFEGITEAGENTDEPELDPKRINEPLEPGSGAPDLNTILRRVRDEGGMREGASTDTAKSDFVAAARRAAKAAAAEAEMEKRGQKGTPEKSGKFILGNIVRGRKKSLLMLAGAAVVVAGGLHFGRSMLFNSDPADLVRVAKSADEQPKKPSSVALNAVPKSLPAEVSEETITAAIPTQPGDTPDNAAPSDISASNAAPAPQVSPPMAGAKPLPATAPEFPDLEAELGGSTLAMELPEIPAEIGPDALREAAADGEPEALYEIGNRYAEGRGIKADSGKAAEWYRLAAERGLAPAQYRLGNLYEKAIGVDRDIDEAKTWYQLAAQQGNASAMHNLGVLFATGADGVADNESAARWFLKAAELGLTDSQVNLGILSAKGIGISRNLSEAYKWFAVAAETGDKDAAAKRDEVAKAMAEADLARAKAKARLWKAHEPNQQANVVAIPDEWKASQEITASVDMSRAIGNVQLILNKNGYDAGPPDGIMGERTRAAIRAFQEQNGLTPTGELDDALVRALLQKNESS